MNYLRIISILLIIVSCKNNSKTEREIELKNSSDKITEYLKSEINIQENATFIFPFGYELNNFKLDSTNQYGAGDCWGKIKQFSENELSIGIDSMSCGEYGFEYNFYLLKNNRIKIVHSKESETLIEYNNRKTEYLLTEKVYDFRENPFVLYYRKDTVSKPDFRMIKAEFHKSNIVDFKTILENEKLEYNGVWKMIEEY
jgi:hypothetical protein